MLELRDISYSRGRRKVVDCVDLAFAPGTITVLFGPRGAGKRSVLRMPTGELAPTSGRVLLDGESIGRQPRFPASRDVYPGVGIRRIVARDTEYVLLDEPAGSGYAKPRYDVPSLFHHLARSGAMVIAALNRRRLYVVGECFEPVAIERANAAAIEFHGGRHLQA